MARRQRNAEINPTTDETEGNLSEAVTTPAEEATSMTVTDETTLSTGSHPEGYVNADAVEVPEAATAEVPEAKAEVEIDLSGFTAAVEAAVAEHDTSTGTVPDGLVSSVTTAYRELDGLKAKNAAKKLVNDAMRESMNEMDIQKARAYMVLSDNLTAGAATSSPRAEKVPTDPTEAFVQKVGALTLGLRARHGCPSRGRLGRLHREARRPARREPFRGPVLPRVDEPCPGCRGRGGRA